ncbi:hypothetical protein PG996_008406 [Apiospora saccharicola]|uniref:Dolichol phosphate-mannose biosynthesis regulatory protein n=1 Tax=Apiospora saccharicola TaxID=335842 RepID=A0ABR1V100_9PEZI
MSLVSDTLTTTVLAVRDGAATSSIASATHTHTPVPSNGTKTSFFHRADLELPPLSWFDSQASWPLALIPLAFAILFTIGLVAVTGSGRERILGMQNPAHEKAIQQIKAEHEEEMRRRRQQQQHQGGGM